MAGLGVPPGVSLRGGVTTMSTDAALRLTALEDADIADESDITDLQADVLDHESRIAAIENA